MFLCLIFSLFIILINSFNTPHISKVNRLNSLRLNNYTSYIKNSTYDRSLEPDN